MLVEDKALENTVIPRFLFSFFGEKKEKKKTHIHRDPLSVEIESVNKENVFFFCFFTFV